MGEATFIFDHDQTVDGMLTVEILIATILDPEEISNFKTNNGK